MNRIALWLIALTGSVAGGVAVVQGVLGPNAQILVECVPDGDCVMAASPAPEQCAVLLEGGGDRPGEVSGLQGQNAEAARILYALLEGQAISGFKTTATQNGCLVAMALSRQQAAEWREVLLGNAEGSTVEEAVATLVPANPAGVAVQWGGASAPEDRTEAWDLAAK